MHRRALLPAAIAAILAVSVMGPGVIGAEGDPAPTLVPTAPEEGPHGLRVVQPWTGTQLHLREGWSLETLQPAPDLDRAPPGQTWEALRTTSPLGQRTCSLYVAVAEEGQPSLGRVWAHTKPRRAIKQPRWDFRGKRPALLYPDPAARLAPAKAWTDDDWDATTKSCNPGLEHEILQVWACAETVDTEEERGYGPDGIQPVYTRDPEPGEAWGTTIPAGEMSQPRANFTATLLPDGRVLLAGGVFGGYLASAELWHPQSRTFQPAGEMKRRRSAHSAVLQPDGGVLMVGGTGRFGHHIKDAELWDPLTSTFSPAGKLRTPRTATATVTAYPDGRALVVGGSAIDDGQTGPALGAEIWEPGSGDFKTAGRLDSARTDHRTFALPNGDAVVTAPDGREWLRWDAAERRFEPIGQPDDRRSETYQLSGGQLLAVGVTDESTCRSGKAYAATPDAELWLPRQQVFRNAGAFKAPRYGATVTPLPDGDAFFYGGGIATCMDATHYPSAEIWDAGRRTFRRAGRTELPHWDEATALLADGRVAVIGGIGTDDYTCPEAVLGTIELWDPVTRTFSVAGALDQPRSGATALTLDDGSVLILGGIGRTGEPLGSAELWVPPPAG